MAMLQTPFPLWFSLHPYYIFMNKRSLFSCRKMYQLLSLLLLFSAFREIISCLTSHGGNLFPTCCSIRLLSSLESHPRGPHSFLSLLGLRLLAYPTWTSNRDHPSLSSNYNSHNALVHSTPFPPCLPPFLPLVLGKEFSKLPAHPAGRSLSPYAF